MKTKKSQRIFSVIIFLIVFFLIISNPFEREEIAIIDLLEEELNLKTDKIIGMDIKKIQSTHNTISVTGTKSEYLLTTLQMTKVKKSFKNKVDLLDNYILNIYDGEYMNDTNSKDLMIKYHSGKTYILLMGTDDTILYEATTNSLFQEVVETYRGL